MIVAALLMVALSVHTCSGQDEGSCSYWYNPHFLSGVCPCEGTVPLECVVTVPQVPSTLVRWYRTQNEEFTAEEATEIQSTPGKYLRDDTLSTVPDQNGFISMFSELFIIDFCDNDTGYYWCQIVINGTVPDLLEPSYPWNITSGNVTVGTQGDPCSTGNSEAVSPRKCAEVPNSSVTSIVLVNQLIPSSTLPYETTSLVPTSTLQYEITSLVSTNTLQYETTSHLTKGAVSTETLTTSTAKESMTTPLQTLSVTRSTSAASSTCMLGGSPCGAAYGAIGAAVVVVALVGCSMVVIVGVVCLVRKRKKGVSLKQKEAGIEFPLDTITNEHYIPTVEYAVVNKPKKMDHLGSTESPRYEELDKPGIKTSNSPAKGSQHEIKEKQDPATEEKPQDLPQDQVESATNNETSELTYSHLDHGLSNKAMMDETRPQDDQHTYSCLQDGASKTDPKRKHEFNNRMNITKEETIGHEYELISEQQLQGSREIPARPSAADGSHTTTAKDHFYHVLEEQKGPVENTAEDEYMYVSTDRMSMNRKKNWKRLPSPSPKPDTQGHFYHVLEGPTDTSDSKSNDQYYSVAQEPPHVIKETQLDEQQYDEPLHPKGRDVSTQQDASVLFDNPEYQLLPPQNGAPEPEGLYSKPDKKPMLGQQDHFYHTLEGPPGDSYERMRTNTVHHTSPSMSAGVETDICMMSLFYPTQRGLISQLTLYCLMTPCIRLELGREFQHYPFKSSLYHPLIGAKMEPPLAIK